LDVDEYDPFSSQFSQFMRNGPKVKKGWGFVCSCNFRPPSSVGLTIIVSGSASSCHRRRRNSPLGRQDSTNPFKDSVYRFVCMWIGCFPGSVG
jgi:hypothetical protein